MTSRSKIVPENADIRLVALDLDGTILESGTTITDEVVETLLRLHGEGVACVTASGRPFDFQVDLLERHGLGPATECFTALIADERELYLLDGRPTGSPAFRPYDDWNDLVHRRWQALSDTAWQWANRGIHEARRRGWTASATLSEAEVRDRGLATIHLDDPQQATEIRTWLDAQLAQFSTGLACNTNVRLVQVYDAEVGKGPVLATLADLWNLGPGQILAVGDTFNDESMLDGSFGFLSGTTANAADHIKTSVIHRGGYVAAQPIGAGVIEVIGHFLPNSIAPLPVPTSDAHIGTAGVEKE